MSCDEKVSRSMNAEMLFRSRRWLLRGLLGSSVVAGLAAGFPAAAQFRVEVSGVGSSQLPLAIVRFKEEERSPDALSEIVRSDLERTGAFRMVDTSGVAMDEASRPDWAAWRSKATDALLAGSVNRLADGRYDVRYHLWDAVKGADLGLASAAVGKGDLRLQAHHIADEVYARLTGERGVFATRISYVTKAGGRYYLWVADSDGLGAQEALRSSEPIISPAWSPDGRQLAYVSFDSHKAVVVMQEVATGKRRVVANFKGSNSAPTWSPDGSRLVVTLTRDGISQLYSMDRQGGSLQRLTQSGAIDTEAAFSADGRSLYFVSDRGGSPQIYRMPSSGGAAERVTFSGSYNISPALSPDGRHMAYIARQSGGAMRLMLMDLSSGNVSALTDTRDDESPSFAPNSRLIIYASRAGGRDVLMTTNLDGSVKARLASTQADVREPVWGPFTR